MSVMKIYVLQDKATGLVTGAFSNRTKAVEAARGREPECRLTMVRLNSEVRPGEEVPLDEILSDARSEQNSQTAV